MYRVYNLAKMGSKFDRSSKNMNNTRKSGGFCLTKSGKRRILIKCIVAGLDTFPRLRMQEYSAMRVMAAASPSAVQLKKEKE